MGLFSKKETVKTNTKFNQFSISEDGYLVINGLSRIRIPLKHIDTVVSSVSTGLGAEYFLKIVGKGVVLCEVNVLKELVEEVQDWILEKLIDD